MTTTNHLELTYLETAQAQKEVTVNAALARIDAILNTGVIDKDLSTPPGSPSAGDVYIVGASPTGDWAGQADAVACFDQAWTFITPNEGMTLWVGDENLLYSYDGADWVISATAPATSVQTGGDTNNSGSGSGSDYDHSLTYTIPANYLASGKALRVTIGVRVTTGSVAPTFLPRLKAGATVIYEPPGTFTPPASVSARAGAIEFIIAGTTTPGASAPVECFARSNTNISFGGVITNNITTPVNLATNGDLTLTFSTQWGSAGTGTNTITQAMMMVEEV